MSDQALALIEEAVRAGAEALSLSDLDLGVLPPTLPDLAGTLLDLDLSHNRIEQLPEWLGGFPRLRSLDLSHNRIVDLPRSLAALTSLTRLYLTDNLLIKIPVELAALSGLEVLEVAGNRHLLQPPPGVTAQGSAAVIAYLRQSAAPAEPARPAPDPEEPVAGVVNGRPYKGAAIGGVTLVVVIAAVGAGLGLGLGSGGATATRQAAGSVAAGQAAVGVAPAVPTAGTPTTAAGSAAPSSPVPGSVPAVTSPPAHATTNPPVKQQAVHSAAPPAPPASPKAPAEPSNVDFALGRPVSVTSYVQNYVGSNLTDGDTSSYWEGAQNSFPQTVSVSLSQPRTISRIVLSLPPLSDWNSRTQTIQITGSLNGGSVTVRGSAGYSFDANSSGNDAVTVTFSSVEVDHLSLEFTANSGWYAAQLSELAVYR